MKVESITHSMEYIPMKVESITNSMESISYFMDSIHSIPIPCGITRGV